MGKVLALLLASLIAMLTMSLIIALVGAASCPSSPPGVAPRDPGIPSGALCRGACGGDCPNTCRNLPDISICVSDGEHDLVCTYTVIECGSHQGCREHDDCYDACAAHSPDPPLCRRGCDLICIDDYGIVNCTSWALGNGPYDSWLKFSYPPVQTDCNDDDGCYAYDNGCEDRDYYCSGGSCTYTYSNRHTDYYDDWVYYCDGDNARKKRLFHNFYCDGGSCTDHTSWVDDQLVEDCNQYDGWVCDGNIRTYCNGICIEDGCCACEYPPPETEDCDEKDGWYPDGANAEEYRDYYCSNGECVYNVTDHRCNEGYKNCDDDWSNGCECSKECCGAGTPNAGACYTPGASEDGCCSYAGGCYDGTSDPAVCTVCYGGGWHPDWWCEEGECVPEASTLVLLATGLLFLAGYIGLRRKEN